MIVGPQTIRLGAVLAAALLAACAARAPAPTPPKLPPIIDAHTHTDFTGEPEQTSHIPDTRARYLAERREAGVVASVSHVAAGAEPRDDLAGEHVLQCAGVAEDFDAARLDAQLASRRAGCLKIYLGYVHRFAYDPAYEPIYALAAKHHVPVVFHTGDTYSTKAKLKYSDPLTIDDVAVDHPDVTFVIAHCGNPWIQSAAEVAYKNPNVVLECSALLIGDLSERSPEDVERYLVEPVRWIFGYVEDPSKLMFGTDWPLTAFRPYAEAYARAIPEEHWPAVFHDNALRVFRIPGVEPLVAPAPEAAPAQ